MLVQITDSQAIESNGILAVTQNLDHSVTIRYATSVPVTVYGVTASEVLAKVSASKEHRPDSA